MCNEGKKIFQLDIFVRRIIMKIERDAATSGRPIQMRSFLSELRNRHLAEWRFLRFALDNRARRGYNENRKGHCDKRSAQLQLF